MDKINKIMEYQLRNIGSRIEQIIDENQELLKYKQFRIELIDDSKNNYLIVQQQSLIKLDQQWFQMSNPLLGYGNLTKKKQNYCKLKMYIRVIQIAQSIVNNLIVLFLDQMIKLLFVGNISIMMNGKSSQPFEEHNDSVLCLILNKSEDQLISGGYYKLLTFWEVDLNNNELKFRYSIDKYENQVRQLNFNQSESLFASCAFGEIILWQEGANNKWEPLQIIKSSIYRLKLQFINDSKFLWVSYGKNQDKIQVYSQQYGKFEEQLDSLIQLDKNIEYNDYSQFPIIYNQELEIIIVRHKHKIYIIKYQKQDKFRIIYRHDFGINDMCGALTKNGEYLVLFDQIQQQLQIFRLFNK
ncbi:unnamed protein product (macronuclear) [Paramecium tetraurelia]|uniref:Uncharacterized protein n=1 Tax=Paramecium tetraurelia TaxID=5888 RepID=A0DNU0_PARTE|nr:uncharacterized protein GSPATT00018903001 [Paramecium tetraurelia]CAK84707.1 unnamed protein product [Paramecium tetraurelia]|eukprot:XP_001452104.1 hypothetical protein (macronuclear) [Paramecium tetraurelia strain d4-2]